MGGYLLLKAFANAQSGAFDYFHTAADPQITFAVLPTVMKKILGHLSASWNMLGARQVLLCALLAAAGIFFNYHYSLNECINSQPFLLRLILWYLVLGAGFWLAYLLAFPKIKNIFTGSADLRLLLLVTPAIFAQKMALNFSFAMVPDRELNDYLNGIIYYPLKLIMLVFLLWILLRAAGRQKEPLGLAVRDFKPGPYLLMLAIMVPLILAASTQPDFLVQYPRMSRFTYLQQADRSWEKLLYLLSYGIDFFSIELFFRGFLVLIFVRYAGIHSILPMAVFYCTIHFGKPLGECISSFFGGLLLGVVTYHSRSIVGGLIVHLGIAWLMELGGWLGRTYFQ